MSEAESVARQFVSAINSHDLDALGLLIPDDHVFIDSLGRRLRGREGALDAWSRYFAWFPDYSIEIERSLVAGEIVAFFGSARGTLASRGTEHGSWLVPSAWRATVRARAILEWQVYADNKPVYDLFERVASV